MASISTGGNKALNKMTKKITIKMMIDVAISIAPLRMLTILMPCSNFSTAAPTVMPWAKTSDRSEDPYWISAS